MGFLRPLLQKEGPAEVSRSKPALLHDITLVKLLGAGRAVTRRLNQGDGRGDEEGNQPHGGQPDRNHAHQRQHIATSATPPPPTSITASVAPIALLPR